MAPTVPRPRGGGRDWVPVTPTRHLPGRDPHSASGPSAKWPGHFRHRRWQSVGPTARVSGVRSASPRPCQGSCAPVTGSLASPGGTDPVAGRDSSLVKRQPRVWPLPGVQAAPGGRVSCRAHSRSSQRPRAGTRPPGGARGGHLCTATGADTLTSERQTETMQDGPRRPTGYN